MKREQVKNSGILIFSNLVINLTGFLRQIIMAWFLGISGQIDLMLLSMIVPAIIQSMVGGGAGEILVIKRDKEGYREGSFETLFIVSCLLPVLILGIIYFLSIRFLLPFFKSGDADLFYSLSLIFIINMLPGTFTSVLRPHLYSRGLYGFYAVTTVISQFISILFIILTVRHLGIFAFAWSYLLSGVLNAILFSFRSGLYIPGILNIKIWRHETAQHLHLLKKLFSLSLQTLLNHLATFWERSLSVKYLTAGYLSSLNYSKTINELPNTVLLSSVLTTSYIEQTRLHKESYEKFAKYTESTLRLLIRAGFLLQTILLVLAPVIIILVFRRGKFDNDAVKQTLVIFNILTVGFLPRLIMNFFSRTMYILGEYNRLLFVVFMKLAVQVAIMVCFINLFENAIPFAIISGFIFSSFLLFFYAGRILKNVSIWYFIIRLAVVTVSSLLLLALHNYIIDFYIGLSNLRILIYSLPLIIFSVIIFVLFLEKNGIETGLIKRIKTLSGK